VEHGQPHGWSIKPTQPAAWQANAQGVRDVGGSESQPVIGGRGPRRTRALSNPPGGCRPTGRVGREGRQALGNTGQTGGAPTTPHDRGLPPTIWHQIDWSKAERSVHNRRVRVFRAAQEPRWKQVRNLPTLFLRRDANTCGSVWRIPQSNRGRRTPGIDGERWTRPEERATLVDTRCP
jgi:hypothetical protein